MIPVMLRKDYQQFLYIFARQDCKAVRSNISENVYHSYRFVHIPMYSVATSKVCYVTTVLKRQQILTKYQTFFISLLGSKTHCTNLSIVMASKYFKGHNDHYNGVTIDSNEESCTPEEFAHRLTASIQQWTHNKKRTIWFRIYLPHSELIPILVKEGFKYHHAKQDYVVLYRWLPTEEECNVPHYAHTNLGIGGFVYNEETKEVLVVKEKFPSRVAFWKLPGGYVEPGEDLENAVKREVLEETGVPTTFKCILCFRHVHDYAFNCSDVYMVAYLAPLCYNIKKCDKEIADCRWMKISEYLEHTEVHENNKLYAKKMLECIKDNIGLTVEHAIHPTTNKSICIYSLSKINST